MKIKNWFVCLLNALVFNNCSSKYGACTFGLVLSFGNAFYLDIGSGVWKIMGYGVPKGLLPVLFRDDFHPFRTVWLVIWHFVHSYASCFSHFFQSVYLLFFFIFFFLLNSFIWKMWWFCSNWFIAQIYFLYFVLKKEGFEVKFTDWIGKITDICIYAVLWSHTYWNVYFIDLHVLIYQHVHMDNI